MEGGFEFAFGAGSRGGAVMKETVGQRSAELFVEEHGSPSGNSMVGEGGGNEIGYFATLAA